jgi:hypothetical protein
VSLDAGQGGPRAAQVVALRRRFFYLLPPDYPPPAPADPWLVVWGGTRIRGARIAPDGAMIDPFGIELSLGVGAQFFPGVASDGRSALVTWGRDPAGISAQVVGPRPATVQDLIAWLEQLVTEGRLSALDGGRLVHRLAYALALNKEDAILAALEKVIQITQDLYLANGRITIEDGASLILQARWLLRTLPTANDAYADLGNEFDEPRHHLRGWGLINPGLLAPEIDPDRTSRYQLLRGSNTVYLAVPVPGAAHTLSFRTEDGVCDDSFAVYVNDRGPAYSYRADPARYIFPLHQVPLDGSWLSGATARITFVNTAQDTCGLAATYFVRLATP